VAGWNQLSLVLPVEWLPNSEPCRSNGRVPSALPPLMTRYFVQPVY
jgi:hypothetical protein